jgi:hypothetical protein
MKSRSSGLQRPILFSAFVLAMLFPLAASADTITEFLTIQVYQVCDDAGANCASLGPVGNPYFGTETSLIWSQAGIGVEFNFVDTIDSTRFSTIDDTIGSGRTFSDLDSAYGVGPSSTTVDMFLVSDVDSNTVYGEGWLGYGGLVINMDLVMAYNGGVGRIDTIAHELGHNLGLVPSWLGGDSGGHSGPSHPNYLMASGSWRNVPLTSADISPNGQKLDLLPPDQIAYARTSSLLSDTAVPEPAGMPILGGGLVAVGLILRRRKS